MCLTRSFLQGLTASADCAVQVMDIIRMDVQPCLGCFACWKNGDGKCIQQDDQNDILAAYVGADIIIWSFPLYCYGMPSHIKAVLDRTIPLIRLRMKEVNGRVQHESLVDFSGKRTLVICGAGFPDWEGNFDGLKQQCRNCFGNLTMLCVPETPLLNIPAAKPLVLPLLEQFQAAGHEYARSFSLSPETVMKLETPMMSREDYLADVNNSR